MGSDLHKDSVFLVTGGAGFIGSNLCEKLLDLGYSVRCLDDLSTGQNANVDEFLYHPKYSFIRGDIKDLETCQRACENVDFVLHQAAWGSVPRSIEMPIFYEVNNVLGTLNMMQAALQAKVKRFVYASSSSVYGDEPSLPKVEGREGRLLSPYALTKRSNEEYAILFNKLYGLNTIGLRYFNVFGRRQNPDGSYAAVIPKFIKKLLLDEAPTIYGDGKQSRDFTYIDNVIQANLRACVAPVEAAGQVFNIASGGREYLIDIYYLICDLLNKKIEPVFSSERPGDIKHSNADVSKAMDILGYKPSWNFRMGIEKTIEWYSK